MNTPADYDRDFYAWAYDQAAKLRSGRLMELDLEHLAEEIEDLGKSEKRQLKNRLVVVLAYLLKWQFQPDKRSVSWEVTIHNQRIELASHLSENPSLKAQLDKGIAHAYKLATGEAWKETELALSVFPSTCPYTREQICDDDFWPDA